jgi:hypothetical protein
MVGGRRRNPRAHQGTDVKIGPAARNSFSRMLGSWLGITGSHRIRGWQGVRPVRQIGVHRDQKGWLTFQPSYEGFGCRPLCRCAGAERGAGVRKPRKEETAGRKSRGLAGRELWGFEGRGRIGHMAAGAGCGQCWRRERTRRAFLGARMRAAAVGAAAGESLGRS